MTARIALGLWFRVLLSALVGLAVIPSTPAAAAELLIVAPHPDDDVITSAGVIYRAVQRGDSVRVVYVTNGDAGGVTSGYSREAEAVEAQSGLGVIEDRLMFFGYPDGGLDATWNTATSPTSQYTSPNTGRSTTYGNRGLGRLDYHTYRHGTPAKYNRPNMVADMVEVLSTYLPTHIFLTSQWDGHADHATSYLIVQEAVNQVIATHPGYNPTLHKTQVWRSDNVWPNALDASTYFAIQPNLDSIGLVWSERESLDVPTAMQNKMYGNNPKYMAIDSHKSQSGVYQFLGRFVHKDEFFWTEQKSGANAPPVPNAGFDQSVVEGAAVVLDGSTSFDRNGDALSFYWAQVGGTPVALSGATTAHPSLIAPTGLTQDAILVFELVVSDGVLTSVPDAVSVRVTATTQPPPPTNIGPTASTITASSQNAADGQTANKAVDGVIDGYPGDSSKEWSTDGQGAGAWIELAWSGAHYVNGVRLHDRPNENDQVVAGTLRFSDGSTVPVGRLPNPGAGLDVGFPSRSTTSLRFTIDAITQGSNIGLAEFLVFEGSSTVDRCAGITCSASDQCHVVGVCDPSNGVCSNPTQANGTSCNDANACTQTDTCQVGTCTGGSPVVCTASDQCHLAGTCSPTSGTCSDPTKANGTTCSDGNGCTATDTCQAGACTSGSPVVCTAADQCHDAGTCSPEIGTCSNQTKPNETACNDGSACTPTDTCQSGVCTGANPVVCTASDQCHVAGTCSPTSGTCSNPTKANGTACSDGNGCTLTDTCQTGTCTSGSPVVCTASDQCHVAGTCSPASGTCSNPTAANGVSCDDGDACTTTDTCSGGLCVGQLVGATTHLVISQLQTRGDGSSPSKDEFVEIFNPTAAPINSSGLFLIYKPVGGTTTKTILTIPTTTAAVVPARDWILIARNGYNGSVIPQFTYNSVDLPAAGGTIYLATEKVALCTSNNVVDKVAWGTGDCPETTATAAPAANNSVMRRPATACGNGQDTNNNATDFVGTAPSAPRN